MEFAVNFLVLSSYTGRSMPCSDGCVCLEKHLQYSASSMIAASQAFTRKSPKLKLQSPVRKEQVVLEAQPGGQGLELNFCFSTWRSMFGSSSCSFPRALPWYFTRAKSEIMRGVCTVWWAFYSVSGLYSTQWCLLMTWKWQPSITYQAPWLELAIDDCSYWGSLLCLLDSPPLSAMLQLHSSSAKPHFRLLTYTRPGELSQELWQNWVTPNWVVWNYA